MPFMPTIVSKGSIFADFDTYLETSANQLKLLRLLKGIVATATDPVEAIANAGFNLFQGTNEKQHTQEDWFGLGNGPRSSHFRTLSLPLDPTNPAVLNVNGHAAVGAPTDTVVKSAQALMVFGMIEALETALGVDDGIDNFAPGGAVALPVQDRPIEIIWVCGKGSGFECQVLANSRQVTLCLVTPPVKWSTTVVTGQPDANRRAMKQNRAQKGMILVRPTGPKNPAPIKQLMTRLEGGV